MAKRRIRVLGAKTADCYTSAARAVELIAKRRARYVDEHTIELIAGDPGAEEPARSPRPIDEPPRVIHSPRLPAVVPFRRGYTGEGFLPYPQKAQWTQWILDRRGGRVRRRAA